MEGSDEDIADWVTVGSDGLGIEDDPTGSLLGVDALPAFNFPLPRPCFLIICSFKKLLM